MCFSIKTSCITSSLLPRERPAAVAQPERLLVLYGFEVGKGFDGTDLEFEQGDYTHGEFQSEATMLHV